MGITPDNPSDYRRMLEEDSNSNGARQRRGSLIPLNQGDDFDELRFTEGDD